MANRLRKVKVDEVSLVPRAANPFSDVLLHKNDPTPDDVHVPVPLGDRRKTKKRRFPGAKGDTEMPQIDKSALDPQVAAYVTELEDKVLEMADEIEKNGEPEVQEDDDSVESLLKSANPALVEYVQSIEKAAADAQAIAKAEQDKRLDREFLAKADTMPALGSAREVADILKSAAENLPADDFTALETLLTTANTRAETALFAELGKAHQGNSGGSDKIEKAAEAKMAEDSTLTKEQAVDLVVQADPALYRDYIQEG